MKLLAVDTSTPALSLALGQGALNSGQIQILASQLIRGPQQHGQTLVPAVERLLHELQWTSQEIEGIIIGIGPGSYTGLRIGVTFAKIWGQFLQIPVYPVSSLAMMAAAVTDPTTYLMPIMDARRQTGYTGLYQFNQQLNPLLSDVHFDFQADIDQLEPYLAGDNQKLTIIGDEIAEFGQIISQHFPQLQLNIMEPATAYPQVGLIFNRLKLTECQDVTVLEPNYCHESLAVQEWQAKHSDDEMTHQEWIDHYD